MIGDYERMPAQQGWQCPICGRVYSPTTMMCLYCISEKESVSTNIQLTGFIVKREQKRMVSNDSDDWPNDYCEKCIEESKPGEIPTKYEAEEE